MYLIAPVLIALMPIDSAWMQSHGPAPYVLSQPDTIYQLQTDVTTSGNAFKIMASGITLDLNGHTITYDNAAPIAVVNAGFESGTLEGWDSSKAPDAKVVPIPKASWTTGWWGNSLCEMAIPAGGHDYLATSPVVIPYIGVNYTATMTVKGPIGTSVTVSVVDSVTGSTLGSTIQPPTTIGNGGSINVPFKPTTSNPVKLAIDVTPPPGKPATVDMDFAAINRSGVYGVDFNWNQSNIRITSSVAGGRIVQGSAQSTSSSPIYNNYGVRGLTVDNLAIHAGGQDTNLIHCTYSSNVTIRNNTLTASVPRIYNRQANFSFIYLVGATEASGTYDVENNQTLGSHQNSIILFGQSNFTKVLINGNTLQQNSSWTDGYGIQMTGVNNFEVAHNTITPVSGRGILLQAWKGKDVASGNVHDNQVLVQEHANLEYPASGLTAVAFRFRNYDGRISNVDIGHNTFSARTGEPGQDLWAVGARFNVWQSYNGTTGQMTDCGVVFHDNLVKAIVTRDDPALTYQDAYALSLATFDGGTGMSFRNNTLESNDASLNLGCSDGTGESDITLDGTVFKRSSEGISLIRSEDRSMRGYVAVEAGLYNGTINGVHILGSRYAGGSESIIRHCGTGSKTIEVH